MSAWTTSDIPDQTDRIAVVTGANSGIGLETTRVLARSGAAVVMACRDVDRGTAALAGLDVDRDRVTVMALDLTEPQSIEAFAAAFETSFDRLDLLINNAGIMASPKSITEAGVERQWATNHLGHFALTGLLLPHFIDNEARVVSVSSLAAAGGNLIDPIPTNLLGYSRFRIYSDTKLANQVFAVELNHRLAAAGSKAISVAAHPGVSNTNLISSIRLPFGGAAMTALSRFMTQPAAAGALPVLRAATDPAVEGGQYYGPSGYGQYRGSPTQIPLVVGAARRGLGRSLWDRSMALSGVRYLAGD